ncbi:MAG: chemotaxis response regulator protein-glutamate methylesterase, partial [Gammaproteobacteria bacterium]|nr:chemotaxis response regulator protein-glutamate methylesterase [Gammaproteobacteria bacterium]
DFLPKRFGDISSNQEEAQAILCSRVKLLGRQKAGFQRKQPAKPVSGIRQPVATGAVTTPVKRVSKRFSPVNYDLIAIGTSTGGPVALQELLTQLPANFTLPILIVQHMPAKFTEAFANRLNQLCKIEVREAKDKDVIAPGVALLAPGGMQMVIDVSAGKKIVRIREETDPMQNYKPCVDVMFDSLASTVGNRVLGIILTGMGSDGKVGCTKLISKGATIWAQDENTSTIYGMPAAVAGIAEQILPLQEIGKKLALNS